MSDSKLTKLTQLGLLLIGADSKKLEAIADEHMCPELDSNKTDSHIRSTLYNWCCNDEELLDKTIIQLS